MSPIAAHKMVLIYYHDDFALHTCQSELVNISPDDSPAISKLDQHRTLRCAEKSNDSCEVIFWRRRETEFRPCGEYKGSMAHKLLHRVS
jgi:hypothetical protein